MTDGWTHDEQVNRIIDWIVDYRLLPWEDGGPLIDGMLITAALAATHPEYLQAFAQLACASEDADTPDLPRGHAWLEQCEVADYLTEQCPIVVE